MLLFADDRLSQFELQQHRNGLRTGMNPFLLQSCNMWKQSHEFESGDIEEIRRKLGIAWAMTCKNIQQFFYDQLSVAVSPYSLRYQCMTDQYIINPHLDGPVRDKSLDSCYSSIVYLNDEWDETLGGNFEIEGNSVASLPNRLVIYSRDTEHWVSPALSKWNLPRQMLLISWSKNNG